MRYIFVICLISMTRVFCFTQTESSTLFSDCFGALEVNTPGRFQLALTGSPGIYDDLFHFTPQLQRKEENSLWLRIEITASGSGNLFFENLNSMTEILVFRNEQVDCSRILEGNAKTDQVGLVNNSKFHYTLGNVQKGEVVLIGLNTLKSVKEVTMIYEFTASEQIQTGSSAIRLLDRRSSPTDDYLLVQIRDEVTGEPINAQVVIRELNRLNALYNATDIQLPKQRTLNFQLSVDAQGYFPVDTELKSTGAGSDTIVVMLVPVEPGRVIELQGIEFQPQSSDLLPQSEALLLRLRDFLVFNPHVSIEIQGHVHHLGKNTFTSKRLSSRRAKSVKKYLIRNGIDKKRLVANGYGNTHMKFPEAATKSEEQANRRVEVRIIE
jgi:outer membrane protein OmpA-like peptidoglycan-associated protein